MLQKIASTRKCSSATSSDYGDEDGDGYYGDGSLQCDVGVAGKRGPLQRPHGVRGDGNEPKTQTKMQMSQKHRARNSRNRNYRRIEHHTGPVIFFLFLTSQGTAVKRCTKRDIREKWNRDAEYVTNKCNKKEENIGAKRFGHSKIQNPK